MNEGAVFHEPWHGQGEHLIWAALGPRGAGRHKDSDWRREARGTNKSGSSETTAAPCVSNLTSAWHVKRGMSKSGSSRKKLARFVCLAELEGLA